jgi:hypothetical protein
MKGHWGKKFHLPREKPRPRKLLKFRSRSMLQRSKKLQT